MHYKYYQTITLNGNQLKSSEIIDFCRESEIENIRQLGLFMTQWLNDSPAIEVKTSGSTGKPKTIRIEKNQMLQSAALTAEYFNFQQGQTALLCLSMDYIAGKMMVVRALYSGLNLICIAPGNNSVSDIPEGIKIDFAPLVPMQLNDVKNTDIIRKILLGGSPVSPAMEKNFQSLSSEIYIGYGMTETLSHVALRRINGKEKSEIYKALPGVKCSIDERNCLKMEVPFLSLPIQTNDIVDLINEQEFIWRGRIDNVINSGGIKFFPEEIEKKLAPFIKERFFVAGLPDEKLGEKLCLFIETTTYKEREIQSLKEEFIHLSRYEKPKAIYFIKKFATTTSGKIKRKETIAIADI